MSAPRFGPAEAAQFSEQGYVVVEGALSAAVLEGLRVSGDRTVAEEHDRISAGGDRHVPVSRANDRYAVPGTMDVDSFVRGFVLSELMAEICRMTIGPNAYLFSEAFVYKAPHNQNGWVWHQDAGYFSFMGCGHFPPPLSLWIALDDMTEDNGSLRVLPFTRFESRRVVPHDFTRPWTDDGIAHFDRKDENELLLPRAGDIVVFDGRLPHASDPNRSSSPRRAYLVQYTPVPIVKHGKPVVRAEPILLDGVYQPPR